MTDRALSRRAVVALAMATATVPAVAVPAAASIAPDEANQLWTRRTALVDEIRSLDHQIELVKRSNADRDLVRALIAKVDAAAGARDALWSQIEALPPSPNAAAAAMMTWVDEDNTIAVKQGLRKLRPALTGLIATHADWVMARGDYWERGDEPPFMHWSPNV